MDTVATTSVSMPIKAARRPLVLWIATNLSMLTGAGLIAWTAGIHLDLWFTGYDKIQTIGPLFLTQAIGGFVLALALVLVRRLLVALAGLAYMAATIGGLLISVNVGLFGFQDTLLAPFAQLSLIVEIAGALVLVVAALSRLAFVRRQRAVTHNPPS